MINERIVEGLEDHPNDIPLLQHAIGVFDQRLLLELDKFAQAESAAPEVLVGICRNLFMQQGYKQYYEQELLHLQGRKDPVKEDQNERYFKLMRLVNEGDDSAMIGHLPWLVAMFYNLRQQRNTTEPFSMYPYLQIENNLQRCMIYILGAEVKGVDLPASDGVLENGILKV